MSRFDAVFAGGRAPGVYRFPPRASLKALRREAQARGWRVFHLPGRGIRNKASFLAAGGPVFGLPDYTGQNWDAWEEALNDLGWAPASGYLIILDRLGELAASDPEAWATALDILRTAAAGWKDRGKPFFVLARGETPGKPEALEAL